MKKLYLKEEFNNVVLVSGDGDYYKMVKFLLEQNKLERILFPNKKYSSLYRNMPAQYRMNI